MAKAQRENLLPENVGNRGKVVIVVVVVVAVVVVMVSMGGAPGAGGMQAKVVRVAITGASPVAGACISRHRHNQADCHAAQRKPESGMAAKNGG